MIDDSHSQKGDIVLFPLIRIEEEINECYISISTSGLRNLTFDFVPPWPESSAPKQLFQSQG